MDDSQKPYVTSCPLGCLAPLVYSGIVLTEGPLRRCIDCGQLVSNATEAQYLQSLGRFDTVSGTLPNPKSKPRHEQNSARRLGKIATTLGCMPSEIRLLDVGCSSGAFLMTACRLGFRAEGVEPSLDAAQTAHKAGLTVFTGYLEQAQFANQSFDAITLIEIVEHLRDPLTLLRECARILRPRGVVLITTPNAHSWTSRVMGARWSGFNLNDMGGHISFFSPASMLTLATRCGFSVSRIETRNVRFFERGQCPIVIHAATKVAAELLNWPARIIGSGHDLHAYLQLKAQ